MQGKEEGRMDLNVSHSSSFNAVLSLLIMCFFPIGAVASDMDNDIADIQREIDRTVWKVFQNAFESMDGAALNSVYADSVLRVTPDGIDTQNHFKQENETRFKTNIANKDKITLDFWFDSRQTTLSTSYDVGFYRMGLTSVSGSTQYFYGQFHIVLEVIDGQWKIVQDWDTESIGGHPITAEDFGRKPFVRF